MPKYYDCPRCGLKHIVGEPCYVAVHKMHMPSINNTIEVLPSNIEQVRTRTIREAVHKGWYDE